LSNLEKKVYTISVQCRFNIGDYVRFNSQLQKCGGTGKIIGVNIYDDRSFSYTIEIGDGEDFNCQPGILETEILGLELV